jgi:AcrR family transcriptional regulator
MPRRYELRQRAERQQETRKSIVEATVALHQELGPLRTTISDIAERAGVERATVYRHFPDDRLLLIACIGHYFTRYPPPDPDPWLVTADPETRLRLGLSGIYAYHRITEPMISRTRRDVPDIPHVQEIMEPITAHWARVGEVLAEPWVTSKGRDVLIRAAVRHAISFSTWMSLVREQDLEDSEAVEVMVAMVRCLVNTAGPGDRTGVVMLPS